MKMLRHLIILMTMLLCLMGAAGETWAANRTITLKTQTGGKFRYRIKNTDGSWGNWNNGAGGYYTSTQTVTVADGKVIQIVGYPNDDTHYFVKWTGYDTQWSYNPSWTVAEDRTYTVNVTTTARTVNLSVNNASYGSVKISGPFAAQEISTTGNTAVTVGQGATITLTATPASNRYFVNYTGTATLTTYVYTRTIPSSNITYKANFTTSYKTIKISVNTNSWGTAKLSGPVADKSTTTTTGVSVKVGVGAKVTLTATPASGKYWVRWKENDANAINNSSATYEVAADRDLVATFTSAHYTMTVKSNGGGNVRIHNGVEWSDYVTTTTGISIVAGEGARCTVTAYDANTTYGASSGKYFINWKEGSEVASTSYSYGFDVSAARTLTAYFTTTTRTFTVKSNPTAGGNCRLEGPAATSTYATTTTWTVGQGATVLMRTNTPNAGYVFNNWTQGTSSSAGTTVLGYGNTCSVVVGSSNLYCYANYSTCWDGTLATGDYIIENTTGNNFKVNGSGNYPTIGNIKVANNATVNIKFKTNNYVTVMGTITCNEGTLNVSYVDGTTYPVPTLKRAQGKNNNMIFSESTSSDVTKCKLNVTGTAAHPFAMDGGGTMHIDSTNNVDANGQCHNYLFVNDGLETTGHLVYVTGGTVKLDYVALRNSWCGTNGAGLSVVNSSTYPCQSKITVDHCLFEWLRAKNSGGAIYISCADFVNSPGSHADIKNTEIRRCYTQYALDNDIWYGGGGGTAFRCTGSNLCTTSFEGCEIHHNYADADGAGIRWNAPLIDPATIKNCTIHHNWCYRYGGGLRVEGLVEIEGCTFRDNRAEWAGGGISFGTFTTGNTSHVAAAGGVWDPYDGILSLDANTVVRNNWAGHWGGGVHVIGEFVNFTDGSATFYHHQNGDPYQVKLEVNGATIENNTSDEDGGGVYLTRDNEYYLLGADINYGSVKDNTATKGNGYGGGFCLTEDITVTYNSANGSKQSIVANVGKSGEAHDMTMEHNSGKKGGGVYVTKGIANIFANATLEKNIASQDGGGLFVDNGTVNMTGGTIGSTTTTNGNKATSGNGGGFYVSGSSASVDVSGGEIKYNTATNGNGGGFYVSTAAATETKIRSTAKVLGNEAINGGGAYVNQGKLTVNGSSVEVSSNVATTNGGGVYVANGSVTVTNATLDGNTATNGNGGGIYAAGAVTVSGGTISGNHANKNATDCGQGGGIFANAGSGIDIKIQSTSSVTGNTAKDGAGIYAQSGNVKLLTNSKITGNVASNKGGGVFSHGGETTIDCTSAGYIGASGNANTAKYGGGIYANGGTVNLTSGYLQYNTASQDGGGIYADGGTVNVQYAADANGTVCYNSAANRGGGLFISTTGMLYLKNHATIEKNHVPQGCAGGGVYLLGTVQAGATGSKSNDVITVATNYASDSEPADYSDIDPAIRNNIYLPDPVDTQTTDVITIVNGGLNLDNSSIGFSVPGNFVPVIYCSDNNYLNTNQAAIIAAVFEDSELYTARYFPSHPVYKDTYIYLAADTWVQAVTSAPANFNISNIDSEEDLAWLISLVNGLNRVGETGYPAQDNFSGKTIIVTKDLNMSRYGWVPIGMTGNDNTQAFQGTFDGGGHVIKGINCSYLGEGDAGTGSNLGLFGVVNGATIHDVFLNGERIVVNNATSTETFNLGGIASQGSATISNCSTSPYITSNNANTTMGGLVGTLTGGTIHSSSAMPDMTGYTMGGLVGTNGGSLYNNFTNPKYDYSGSGSEFVAGLAAVNNGTIQNCYVRFSRASSLGSAKFGQIVGKTNNANVTVCYNPENYAAGIAADLVAPNSVTVSSTEYGDVVAPYLYYHGNDNIVDGTDETLCNELNDWVSTHSGQGYSEWKRTTAGGMAYSATAGDINGDYPIHEYTNYNCVASTDGIHLDYAASLDAMLTRHTANTTVNLYANDRTSLSTGSGVVVYIDENISLLQNNTTSSITAYSCQTIPGTPRSWHFFSSSLSNSTIGFSYDHYAPFNWSPDPCGLHFSNDDDYALFPSDMPAVDKIDLYCFYEPEYHWINFKRRTDSHWHMNGPDVPIIYTNEEDLVPGKGYLVSIDQDQLLQNRGTLNNGDVPVNLSYTPSNAWAGLLGYNLIGNPYQSYLSFTRFAADNLGIWAGRGAEPTYAVYEDEMGGYIQYKEGSSRGAKAASGILNMHQGFLVRTASATSLTFNNNMRTNEGGGVTFREEQPAYPLINLTVTDDEGVNDFAVLELGRDAVAGAEKLRANDSKGWVYLHHDGENYGILFRSEVDDYQPLWFEASEAGTYTLSWETANGDFEALTLVDNIAGTRTDMLANDSYVFEADPDQYASRFKIFIGDFKGVDELENDGPSTASVNFAFINNDNLIVNGEGCLEVIDVTGRVVRREDLHGSQSVLPMPRCSGVYVLRLTSNTGTMVQKIVIE